MGNPQAFAALQSRHCSKPCSEGSVIAAAMAPFVLVALLVVPAYGGSRAQLDPDMIDTCQDK